MSINVSVIIPVLNEEKVIGQCLDSLRRLDALRDSFEVILVDNGSTDRTIKIAQSFGTALNLIILNKPKVSVAALRNYGAARAQGGTFAFLDSDCVVSPQWGKQALRLLDQPEVGVAGAHFRIPDNSRWVARAWYGHLAEEKQGDLQWVPGRNTWVTRAVFERVGGFDETIETNEDCEFCDRVRAAGLRVVSDSTIAVVHLETPQTLLEFYRKISWHATDGLYVFIRNLPKITNGRPLLFGLYTLICVIGTIVGAITAASQKGFGILAFFLLALVSGSFFVSLPLAIKRKNWNHLWALTLMHMVFGLARGQALLHLHPWFSRRERLRIPV